MTKSFVAATPARVAAFDHLERVIGPALALSSRDFISEIFGHLSAANVPAAIRHHDSRPIFDYIVKLLALQGISDQIAFGYDARNGGVTWAQVDAALSGRLDCPQPRAYWTYVCGYRRGPQTCAEPEHLPACSVPTFRLRKGALNVAAVSLFLFVRDVADGDLVGWIDRRLEHAAATSPAGARPRAMREALIEPLSQIYSTGPKLWNMILADLLLAGDPSRPLWLEAGAGFIAIDSLVHNFLHRTGTLRRFRAVHPYGDGCYAAGGCADILAGLAERLDLRTINPDFPVPFPRFVQHAIWSFCTIGRSDICNGKRIDDRFSCTQHFCPANHVCDRVALRTQR